MSAHSTIYIRRKSAITFLINKIIGSSDSQLESLLDIYLTERLYNCIIVGNDEENDDDLL